MYNSRLDLFSLDFLLFVALEKKIFLFEIKTDEINNSIKLKSALIYISILEVYTKEKQQQQTKKNVNIFHDHSFIYHFIQHSLSCEGHTVGLAQYLFNFINFYFE